MKKRMNYSILIYAPNLVGYVRLLFLITAWCFYGNMYVFIPAYTLAALLDGIDGWLARLMGQCSAFGAWLDVLVDNVGRSLLWTRLYSWGVFVSCLEWTVFVCTHTLGHQWKAEFGAAPHWVKTVMDNGFYTPVGVFTVAGLHVLPPYLYFLQHLPEGWGDLSPALLYAPVVVLGAGRALAMAVESALFLGESGGWVMYLGERVLGVMEDNGWSITTKALGAPAGQLCAYVSPPAKHAVSARDLQVWCVKTHIQQLLSSDENQKLNLLTKDLHSDPST